MRSIEFRKRRRPWEFLIQKLMGASALAVVAAILLIFAFTVREALPIFYDDWVQKEVDLAKLTLPQDWQGEDGPNWAWRPASDPPRHSLLPLLLGTLKTSLIAMLLAIPLGIGAAIYSSEFAPRRVREIVKPVVELLAGIPSVVLGFFALIVLASVLQDIFGYTYRLNAFNAGLALGLAVVPIIYTVAEDAMRAVPQSVRRAGMAVGAGPWQVCRGIVLPAALPGIMAGVVLGFGRAVGETMIVLMASGNAAIISASPFDSARTVAATIAAEMGEVIFGGAHYSVLFLLGSILFLFTFLINFGADLIMRKLRFRLQGRSA
jgi:phosphate transport system permease protein